MKSETAYVIVHPDEFALKNSRIIKNVELYKIKLKRQISAVLQRGGTVFILNLAQNNTLPPDFLQEFMLKVIIIPSLKRDSVNAQSTRLREQLIKRPWIKNIIMTGGWRDACFKHTLNNTFYNMDRVRTVDSTVSPFSGTIVFGNKTRDVLIEIDYEYIF